MRPSIVVPGIAHELLQQLDRYEGREVLARLDDPRDGGALPVATAGVLRARALASLERFRQAYDVLREVKDGRDLGERERIETQVLMARLLRVASPLVDYALDLALAAADAATRAGAGFESFVVDARVEAALLFGRKRCRKLAERQLDSAEAVGALRERVLVARGELALTFDERPAAKAAFAAAVPLSEEGRRRGLLGACRVATVLGEFEAADKALGELGERPAGDVAAKRVRHRLLASQGKWREVADALSAMLAVVPDADGAKGMRLERATALYKAGDLTAARAAWTELANGGDDWAARSASRTLAKLANEEAKRARLVAFPSVAQLKNHCGPASVELCMRFFGVSADQVEVAREIKHPDGGTPVHRMRAFMENAGFVARRIEADLPKLKAILDAQIPVIIEEDYSTTRHVAVAVGYDDRREVLEIQDPMTHEVRETPYEEVKKLREFANDGALVAVPKDRADLLQKLDAAGAVECEYITKTDLAWAAHDKDEHETADRLATEAIALHEAYELAWVYRFVRARAQYDEDRSHERMNALGACVNRILELWPDDEWPQQFLGRVYSLGERWDEALTAFEKARDRDPDDANNHCSIGDCLLELGRKDDARKAFEAALERDPGHTRANENLANASFDAGDISLASMLNECALELAPQNPFNHHVRGRVLGRRGDAKGAAAAYGEALRIAPTSEFYAIERARFLAKGGAIDEALASLSSLAEKSEGNYAIVQLADLAYEYDRLDECLRACDALAARDPKTPTAKAIAAAARAKRGELDVAMALFKEALVMRPTYAWAYREMGRALTRGGRAAEGVTAAAAAVGLASSPLATFLLGDALFSSGHGDEALSYLRSAASSGELDEASLERTAAIVLETEGAGSAHRLFGELGEKHPRDAAIKRAHAKLLLERLWYPGPAGPVLSRLSELSPDEPLVVAKAGDDLMDASIDDEARGEELLKKAIEMAPSLVSSRRLLARQWNARGRFADALAVLEPCAASLETMEDRVHALLGLGREADAQAAIRDYAGGGDDAKKRRRPLDFLVAKAGRRFEEALLLTEALAADAGELEDDGELGRWEKERFECLVALGRGKDAFEFGAAQCADADDRGSLAYEALAYDDLASAKRLAEEALAEDADEVHALHVMARMAELEGDLAGATGIWDRMREVSPWHVHVENLGRLALAAGDLAHAKVLLEESVATGHVCPVSLTLRAELRVLVGDRAGALADATRARGCLQLELRTVSEHIDGLVAALEGRAPEARVAYDRYLKREKLSAADRARFGKVREALGV